MKKIEILILFLILLIPRVYSIINVYPGNAPDENGHMIIVTALSQGKIMTLKESMEYSAYPYAIYNPVPYIPAASTLAVASHFKPELSFMSKPYGDFKKSSTYIARVGHLFWAFIFIFFLIKLTKEFTFFNRFFIITMLGFLPQMIFVQSYVNLDSMGIAVFAYLIWALRENNKMHIAISVFLTMCSKMNYFCILLLPIFYVFFLYRKNITVLYRELLKLVIVPVVIGSLWFLFSYFFSTREYSSFLGFSALTKLYNVQPAGNLIFTKTFYFTSIKSLFGVFGWMNQYLPLYIYYIWLFIFNLGVMLLVKFLIKAIITNDQNKFWHIGFFTVFCLNFLMHYYATYTNAYQPQGRYLFPAGLIVLGYLAYYINTLHFKNILIKKCIQVLCIIIIFSMVVKCANLSQDNPYKTGFEIAIH